MENKHDEIIAEYYRIRDEGKRSDMIDFIRRVPVIPNEIEKGE